MACEELCPPAFIPPARDELIDGIRNASGAAGPSTESRALSEMLAQAADAVSSELAPRALLKRAAVTGSEAGIVTGLEVSVASRMLSRLLACMGHAHSIFGFAVTLGERLDALIAHTQRASLARALFMDAAGSFLVERYAAQVEDSLRGALASQGLELSSRFSPGYCDWGLAHGQQELFRFLSPQTIGISLLPSGMMSPLKSVTGICIAASRVPHRAPCPFCQHHVCRYRRVDGNRLYC